MFKKRTLSFLTLLSLTLITWWILELGFGVFTGIDGFGFKFHKACVEFTESKGTYDFLNLKILCSYNLNTNLNQNSLILEKDFYLTFLNLGLIHLLVASGSHLLIINHGSQYLFRLVTPSKVPNYVILFSFVLISNFCCPVTRSFFQLIITEVSRKKSLGWSKINLTIMSSLIYVMFFPSSLVTLSFWLSLSASLCLALFSSHPLMLSLAFHLGLYPYIYDFTPPSITAVFANIIITPFLGPILIWNSVLYVFITHYRPIGDFVLEITIYILKAFIITPLLNETQNFSFPPFAKYFYGLVFLILILYFQNLKSKKLKRSIYAF